MQQEMSPELSFTESQVSLRFPHFGRKRTKDSFRELVFATVSYIAVYEVLEERIFVHGIRHTSRDWRDM
jgi:plasmid stabilization system protein ParE